MCVCVCNIRIYVHVTSYFLLLLTTLDTKRHVCYNVHVVFILTSDYFQFPVNISSRVPEILKRPLRNIRKYENFKVWSEKTL